MVDLREACPILREFDLFFLSLTDPGALTEPLIREELSSGFPLYFRILALKRSSF